LYGWHNEAKEQVFANEEHITVGGISEKVSNIKKGCKSSANMFRMRTKSERRCNFLWRLEGSRPNGSVILRTESIFLSANQKLTNIDREI